MVTGSSSMRIAERLARFAALASFDDLSEGAREQLKIRVLDALACAIGALDGEPVRLVRAQVDEFDGAGPCSLLGGGHAAPDRAAFYNSALVRYLDFNDSYLTKDETCHPSDNLGAVLAAAEYAGASGRDFLAALALYLDLSALPEALDAILAEGADRARLLADPTLDRVKQLMGLDERFQVPFTLSHSKEG